ncbi:Lipopolysaccharide export system permease protein LptG [Hydrogenovibrio crunogenus]|uniref:Lipopolysaccharide export system permease protein LptG n=1 Tax=Hydrogenovibrio crunogenus TaxID=39765 RepID=A0A4P7P1Q0_9GAMM|nr:LPS export ABC transporter permease LptG [Hydrogenovibrio crunogenus]QBZ83775.1 Lipopolysaccharide export system permease protein LptG [Hydrogenovibrio crunogenus]
MMNLIERYLGRVLVSHTLLVLMVLLIILGFSEFMIQIGKVSNDYTIAKGAMYTVLKLPVYGYEIFPVALLIGTLIGLGGLANHAELTILRVTGWSIRRIFFAVMKSAFILWVCAAVIGEWVAPASESYAKKMRGEALHKSFSIGSTDDFWMRDGERYIHVGRVISDTQFYDVTIYALVNGQLSEQIHAKTARYSTKDGQWVLYSLNRKVLDWQQMPALSPDRKAWKKLQFRQYGEVEGAVDLPVSPTLLQTLHVETRYMGITDLYSYIAFLEENGLDAEAYKLAFWRKLAMPFVILGMIALVFPLIFGSQRQVSIGQRVFVGIMIGMSFHLLNQIFGNLSVVYQLPAIMGAFLPSIVLVSAAFLLMRRLR